MVFLKDLDNWFYKDVWIFINQLLTQNYIGCVMQKRAIVIDFLLVVFTVVIVGLRAFHICRSVAGKPD
jgi:hypothetical protein